MIQADIVIIGAGVVGLAIAERLASPGREIVLLERYDSFGRDTSSRNSEVIHAGFYYPAGSLKAQLCVEGNRKMYEFCAKNNVPHRKCGKLLIANTQAEEDKVNTLFVLGKENGVSGLSLIDKGQIGKMEPAISGKMGMHSPESGILDTHIFMKTLEQKALGKGATVAYSCTVTGVESSNPVYNIVVQDSDGAKEIVSSPVVINCAGLHCDTIASMIMAGIDVDQIGYRIHWCKGEYFAVSNRHRNKLSHLVYPAPTRISLGVHGVLGLNGSLRLGPGAEYVNTVDYSVSVAHLHQFYIQGKELFPFIEESDLVPDMAGIRPKLQSDNEEFRDFVISEESERGYPGFINLIGIESPGLTSSLAIAEYVEKIFLSL